MALRKIVYIIPGFTENTGLKGYQEVIKFFKSRNIKPIPIKISWKYKVMSDYVKQFEQQFKPNDNDEVYLFGFSFGAMIGFISSTKIKPKVQFLCSLSPYFKEDLPYLKKSWKEGVGKRRIMDFKNFSFNELAGKTKCKTILVAGTEEGKELKRRVKDANKKIKNSELFLIKGAKHEIFQDAYLAKLKEIIGKY